MVKPDQDSSASSPAAATDLGTQEGMIVALLTHYGFDLNGLPVEALVAYWLRRGYNVRWVRSAVIEALYQGRYKSVSVDQLLSFWTRRGQPLCHFSRDFERIVCSKLPKGFAGTFPSQFSSAISASTVNPGFSSVDTEESFAAPEVPEPIATSRPEILAEPIVPEPLAPALEIPPDLPREDNQAVAPEIPATVEPEEAPEPVSSVDQRLPVELFLPAAALEDPVQNAIAPSPAPDPDPELAEPESPIGPDTPIPVFKPKRQIKPIPVEPASKVETAIARQPIDQFIPVTKTSEFYSKLKAVAHTEQAKPQDTPTPKKKKPPKR